MAEHPLQGPAEALRRSMLGLMLMDEEKLYYAHPMFWAAFSLVGEGQSVAGAQ